MTLKHGAYIFDIDGTLADGNHRQHWVRTKPKNWNAYNKAMHLDTPIHPVITTLLALSVVYDIVISSGRQDKDRKVTEEWFDKHGIPFTKLYMRKTGDYRDDTIVKEEMLREIEKTFNVIAVFDDRVKVVDMWRKNGLYVFDCNRTREEF